MKRLALVLALLAPACATVHPWQREDLAKPAMRVGGDPDQEAHLDHTFGARESGMNAGASAGGGCGCN